MYHPLGGGGTTIKKQHKKELFNMELTWWVEPLSICVVLHTLRRKYFYFWSLVYSIQNPYFKYHNIFHICTLYSGVDF